MIIGIETFNPSHDMYGNPTALYNVWIDGDIVLSIRRRKQIGYSGRINQAASYDIEKKLGYSITSDKPVEGEFYRNGGIVYYNAENIHIKKA